MKQTRGNPQRSDAELIAAARSEMAINPLGRQDSKRTDMPLRSAYSSSYIEEKDRASMARPRKHGNPRTLDDLFLDTLTDIYYAEKRILKTLPKLAKGAKAMELSAAFEKHRAETEVQVERLEQIFDTMGIRARGKSSPAIDGFVEESKEILEEYEGSSALDAGLVAAAQAVGHYEISRYGTLVAWAEHLGMSAAVKLLKATLAEEKATDEALSSIGKSWHADQRKGAA